MPAPPFSGARDIFVIISTYVSTVIVIEASDLLHNLFHENHVFRQILGIKTPVQQCVHLVVHVYKVQMLF